MIKQYFLLYKKWSMETILLFWTFVEIAEIDNIFEEKNDLIFVV